ncbi:cytochrome b/b6 domain-containing protein [Oscillatoria sp. FACHB-1407]|uniref:cytochrome b/b6 domain-containing protein n=1 Tax=Oscillatoria sp. FACHB-1407 TaxID=2692847 RepID=UPI00168748AD|nr:cytochrome b/b6 domain-containing protein [Oscillatoria sp. FACHB-1407]MBD2460322.1 cytochrome b/b6 domain-containing protein [Oscillatoria sp. FACHB-1407]
MPAKSSPYQPLLLRILHGLTGLSVVLAILTAYWTYDTYDGRWLSIGLPAFKEIEGIHGTFGLYALLIFPAFVIYALRRGQQRLLQPDSLGKLTQVGRPVWWYSLHRLANTVSILALTFALFSGKMMDETWLPRGELNHAWYYAHLISWVVMVFCIALHLLMSAKVGGSPLLLSMLSWRFRAKDNPSLWRSHISNWWSNIKPVSIQHWFSKVLSLSNGYRVLEAIVLGSIIAAWIIPLFK